MYTLLIVDPQYDFIEDGKLPVKGGKEALDNVAKFINNHASEISDIIVTKDWHKADHCSFKAFGGKFPEHCIAESFGAKVYIPIQDAIRLVIREFRRTYYKIIHGLSLLIFLAKTFFRCSGF